AIALIARFFHERVQHRPRRVDYGGAVLLFVSVGALITFLVQGGVAWEWTAPVSVALAGLALAGIAAFLVLEGRVAEPILPLGIFRRRVIATGNAGSFLAGALIFGTSSFIPTFVQGSLGQTAVVAGLSLGAMSVGWPIAST